MYIYTKNLRWKKWNIIKKISNKDFEKLIEKGIIGRSHQEGNISEVGKKSSGFYNVKRYEKELENDPSNIESTPYEKTQRAHIGTSMTKNRMYIEDKYLNYL